MTESKSQKKFEAAIERNFLSQEQLDTIKLEQQKTNFPPLEIAMRMGFLSRKQLDLLDIFADPLSIVPGYRIDGFLGQGGVGTVYKATQLRLDRPVAIKTINRSSARNDLTPKRFEREAKIVGRLRHPNIISAFDFGIHHDHLYLVMEFVDGIDAEKLLGTEKRLPEFYAWYIAQQVCHALENAFQQGVTHRDIKPANLILTTAPAGTQFPANIPFVKVADFGLAKFNDKQLDATITSEHAISGTPFYMSPEQIRAEIVDHRSDIYSLGTTVWHLITGAPPVDGNSPLDVITNKMKLEDEWLDEIPDDMSNAGFQLLAKMCCHDRERRIDDYVSLNREIESVIEQLGKNSLSDTREFELFNDPFSVSAKVITIHQLAKTFAVDDKMEMGDATPVLASSEIEKSSFDADSVSKERVDSKQLDRKPMAERLKSKSKWLAVAFGVLGAIVLPIAIYSLLPTAGHSVPATSGESSEERVKIAGEVAAPFVRLSEFAGPPIILFDGRKMDPTQKGAGTWEPAEGPEGESVLSGNGTRDFRCRDGKRVPLDNFRFVCGFRHNAADLIGFRLLDRAENIIWDVAIEPDKATLKSETVNSTCPVQQFDDKKNFGYIQFRLESQPDHWRIEIDDKLLGEIPKSNESSGAEFTIQLYADGAGPAHFEPMYFRSFKSN